MNVLRKGPLWRKIEMLHRPALFPLPVVILPEPLSANYRRHLETRLESRLSRCSTMSQTITVAVCHSFGVSREELLAKGKKPHALVPRQVAMYLMEKHSGRNTRRVADFFNRDHTCVINARRKVPVIAAGDSTVAARIRQIETYLNAA